MENPKRPDFAGKLQVRNEVLDKVVYTEKGDIALWRHADSKYILRGYANINGHKYHVSLIDNGE
jgi:hypothetical protein